MYIPAARTCYFFLVALVFFASALQVVAATSVPFSIYALNSNGLMDSVKLHHINIAINARNPHAFVLSESKTNSKTGPNLPNGDYNILEEPGVQSDNFHTYKWGIAVGIRKNIQIAQRVAITAASLRGRVVAVDGSGTKPPSKAVPRLKYTDFSQITLSECQDS
ncbi:hypothetical protein B0H14DRAFT_3556671 [Mycena olivaceomarginata]|nr:hypothetical protein B0H14DRAFT_3556671 [Mycena olivaceomarginata]